MLNARPLAPSIGVVQTPAGYGQLMNNPLSKVVDELYQPSLIWNPHTSSQTGIECNLPYVAFACINSNDCERP